MDKYKPLRDFVQTLKDNGFTVITSSPEPNYSYCIFSKDNKLGYVQYDYMSGFSFSSVHKPNERSGTGFCVERHVEDATIHNAEVTINYPTWIGYSVVKYKDLDEYLKLNSRILPYRYL